VPLWYCFPRRAVVLVSGLCAPIKHLQEFLAPPKGSRPSLCSGSHIIKKSHMIFLWVSSRRSKLEWLGSRVKLCLQSVFLMHTHDKFNALLFAIPKRFIRSRNGNCCFTFSPRMGQYSYETVPFNMSSFPSLANIWKVVLFARLC